MGVRFSVLGFGYGFGQLLDVVGLWGSLVVAMWSGQAVVCMWLGDVVGNDYGKGMEESIGYYRIKSYLSVSNRIKSYQYDQEN